MSAKNTRTGKTSGPRKASETKKSSLGPYCAIDLGVNWASKSVEEVQKMMKEAWEAGAESVVSISNHPNDTQKNIALAEEVPNFYFTVGCHPHKAKFFKRTARTDLTDLLEEHATGSYENLVAIGECGLDYFRMFSEKEDQLSAFKFQVGLARKHNLKLYLHCRGSEETPMDAFNDMVKVFEEVGFAEGKERGIVHCFSGTPQQALSFVSWGFKLGVTGLVCNKRRNENLVKTLKTKGITSSHLLIETDSPHMPIWPNTESSPLDLGKIVKKVAFEMGIPEDQLGHQLLKSAREFLAAH